MLTVSSFYLFLYNLPLAVCNRIVQLYKHTNSGQRFVVRRQEVRMTNNAAVGWTPQSVFIVVVSKSPYGNDPRLSQGRITLKLMATSFRAARNATACFRHSLLTINLRMIIYKTLL